MRSFLIIPVWLLTNALTRFLPIKHPWHKKLFTLKHWKATGTKLAFQMGGVLWIAFSAWLFCIAHLVYLLFWSPHA